MPRKLFKTIFLIITILSLGSLQTAEASLVGTTDNATLSLSPNSGIYKVGGTFPVDILVNTHGQNVVVVAAYLSYNPSIFQVTSIDTSGSIFTAEAEKVIDSVNGIIKITRGIPTPGINTVSGNVVTLNIQGLTDTAPSSDNFTFNFVAGSTSDSNVILNDGLGTDILSGVNNGKFSLDGTPPANVSSFTATAGDKQVSLSWTNPTSDFAGVKILRKTGSYPSSIIDGTVIYDSNGTSYIDTGLTNGTTYYYKAFSRDIVLNYSSGTQVSSAPKDSTPPAQINTLSATPLTSSNIRLDWTSVGSDGNTGTASSYDIRYSTSAITTSNWSSATQVLGEPSPKISGSSETITISGFSANTSYYFAIKAIDESSNASILSNTPSTKTFKTADLSHDNFVNSVDFGIMMSYWNSAARPPADINQDGAVNSVDFGIMMSQWV